MDRGLGGISFIGGQRGVEKGGNRVRKGGKGGLGWWGVGGKPFHRAEFGD